jgi:branched-chain amino acid transport system substrate-binding protein
LILIRSARGHVWGRRAKAVLALVGVVGVTGCGTTEAVGNRIAGDRLTIYSSVPLHGDSSISGVAVINGERMALARIGSRIGDYHVTFKVLDDSTGQSDEWNPGQTTANARTAVQDKTSIGYVGDLNSGASAISIPLLNRAGIAQVSPTSTAIGLTSGGAAASPGEPAKYYPTGTRTFARVVPNDSVQANAQVKLQRSAGCTKTYVLDDGEVDGLDAATSFFVAAQSAGLKVVATQMFEPRATNYTSLAAGVAKSGANCVLISAITDTNAVLVTKQIARALPDARIFGTAGLAESTYTNPAQGGIPLALDPRVLITAATLGPDDYPPAGRTFLANYTRLYGRSQPSAIFGYEAMSLMLNAVARATEGGTITPRRSKVVAAIFATRDRHSVLGTYSIDRRGDTSLTRYGVYRVVGGRLAFWKAIDASAV